MTGEVTFLAVLALGALSAIGLPSPAVGQININLGAPGAPTQVVVPAGTAPAYFYDGRYYRYDSNAWHSGDRHDGPWGPVAVQNVPRPVQQLPVVYKKTKFKKGGAHSFCPPGQAKKGNC
jgi:hypothetical protein